MDIKTAFASWGKYVFKCFPQEGRLRSFFSSESSNESSDKKDLKDVYKRQSLDSLSKLA